MRKLTFSVVILEQNTYWITYIAVSIQEVDDKVFNPLNGRILMKIDYIGALRAQRAPSLFVFKTP